jgi:hypothetical protein
MGGHIYNFLRMPAAQYRERELQVLSILGQLGVHARVPRYIAEKPDFGDMDVVVRTNDIENLREGLLRYTTMAGKHVFTQATPATKTGFSCAMSDLQVDIIRATPMNVTRTVEYLSFNDLSNILGKIAVRMGCRYDHRGLHFIYRGTGHFKREIQIAYTMNSVCEYLGLDPRPWQRGFQTFDEMFEWVTSSPFFSPEFVTGGGPAKVKRRRRRRTIAAFIDWLNERGMDRRETPPALPWLEQVYALDDLERFNEPNTLETWLEQVRADEVRAQKVAAKFNGRLVMELVPGLEGKRLGEFMTRMKAVQYLTVGRIGFSEWVLSASPTDIETAILRAAEQWGYL